MKISLRGMGDGQLLRALERKGIASLVGGIRNDMFFDATWPSDELAEFLRASAKFGAFDINPWMTYTGQEVARAKFLCVRPRKVLNETDADFAWMRQAIDELPWHESNTLSPCRLPRTVSLSRIALKPNQLAVVGQWSTEYVVPDAVQTIFEEAELSGVSFKPVRHTPSGQEIGGFSQLFCDRFLPPRIIDVASREIQSAHPEERGFDAMGCLCYEADSLEEAADFNRTGEGNVSFEFPEWVVSGAVRDLCKTKLLKGWAFDPILDVGSKQYGAYTELWTSLLAACKTHRVRGQIV